MTERRTQPERETAAKLRPEAASDAQPVDGEDEAARFTDDGPAEEASAQEGLSEKAAGRFKGEYEYMPLQCPRCGLYGKVKISKLHRTFTCKQCRRVFHVTLQGIVTGERPPQEVARELGAPIPAQKPNWLERWFSRLPPLLRWAVAGGVFGALVVAGMLVVKLLEDPFPTDLGARAVIAGQAFAKGDLRTLERLAMSGTSEALRQWYDKTPREAFAGLGPESNVQATVGQMSETFRRAENDAKGGKTLVADFQTPVEIHLPERADGPATFTVDFLWVKSHRGRWQIDGQWMLDLADHNTSAAKAAAAAREKANPPRKRRGS